MLPQKITALLMAILFIGVATWMIAGALRFRLRGVAVTGTIVEIRSTYIAEVGVCRMATYRYKSPDGADREAEVGFGADATGWAVGDRRKLFMLAHRPHVVHEADSVVREFFGFVMLAAGLWLLRWLWIFAAHSPS